MKCIQKYGKPQRECRAPARWYFRNPLTKELEGPYCGSHARQFRREALRPVEAYPQFGRAQTGESVTTEPCPTCKAPATCRHLSGTHIWDCPNCGEIIATVCYECPDCAVGQAAQMRPEPDEGPAGEGG